MRHLLIALLFTVIAVLSSGSVLAASNDLSVARDNLAAAAAGGRVFVAGGATGPGGWHPASTFSDVVDIYSYDHAGTLQPYATGRLSQARMELAGASARGDVFFGGGHDSQRSATVDIFNAATLQWSTPPEQLSEARAGLAASSAGGKVFFGGGYVYGTEGAYSDVVDIYTYDGTTWARSTPLHQLSQGRCSLAAASAGGKVYFGGGYTSYPGNNVACDTVDIYDSTTLERSTARLSQARWGLAAASAGGKVIFAGGWHGDLYASDVVDIYDTATGKWTATELGSRQARGSLAAATVGDLVYFAGGFYYDPTQGYKRGYVPVDVVDIYNTSTGLWSTTTLSDARGSLAGASLDNAAFFGGGYYQDGTYSKTLDIVGPVPEPATMITGFAAIVGLAAYLRRRVSRQNRPRREPECLMGLLPVSEGDAT